MTDWQKFRLSLRVHPGLLIAIVFTLMTSFTGMENKSLSLPIGITVGFVTGSILWLPVLITAWTDRELRYQEWLNEED